MKTNRTGKMIAGTLAAVMMMTSAASLAASADFIFARNDTILTYDEFTNCLMAENSGDFYNGHEIIETTYHNGVTDYKFMYSDGIFEDDPIQYSEHMATLACSMGHASCTHVENGSYENGAQNIKALLENAGFTDIYESESYTKKPTEDSIACVIASKMVHTKDGDKKVIAIAVRSGGYESEWASNVKLGLSGEAEGFSNAADQVVGKAGFALDFRYDESKSYLREYFEQYGTKELNDGNVIFWLNGFSRGGATANLSAKRLIDATQNSSNSVVAYCVEAPQGGVASEEKPGSDYRTIHNVINEDDFVPYVAPSSMGFKRYGVDHYVQRGAAHSDRIIEAGEEFYSNFENNASDNFDSVIDLNKQTKRMKWQLKEMVGENADEFAPYTYEMYKYSFDKPTELQKVARGTTTTGRFLHGFMNEITASDQNKSYGVTRSEYAAMQNDLSVLTSYLMNDGDLPAVTDLISGFCPEVPDIILRALWRIYKNPFRIAESIEEKGDMIYITMNDDLREELISDIGEKLRDNHAFMDKMKNYPGGAEKAIETVEKLANQLLADRKDLNKLITFAKNADGIGANHQFETTSAWLRSFDDWYDCYYSEEFIEKSVDTLPGDIPVSVVLNSAKIKNIKSANVKIYGKTATGRINKHGEYEVSEEKLLDEVNINNKGNVKTKIPKGIVPESIRVVVSCDDGTTGVFENGGVCTGEEFMNAARRSAPDISYKNISDLEIYINSFEQNGYGDPNRKSGNYANLFMGFKNTSCGNFSTCFSFMKS